MLYQECDIVVIGAGIAGCALGAHLARHARVQVLESEDHPGYHSTGRSAALYAQEYGNATIRALTRASREFLFSPPADFSDAPLVRPRSVMVVARKPQRQAFEAFRDGLDRATALTELAADEAVAHYPILRPGNLLGALRIEGAADIDVHELQQGYRRLLKSRGGKLATASEVLTLKRGTQGWTVWTRNATYRAPVVVNAAGAWADRIGALAHATPIGLVPCRRTVILIDPPANLDTRDWPMLLDVEEQFYIKPDAGLLLASPGDETPTEPSDVQPDELDVALAVDRVERATTLQVRHVRHRWAGLRSFVPDRSPVVGFDPRQPGFFWFAGLGGYGIQTAPAISEFAASLLRGRHECPPGVSAEELSPRRFAAVAHGRQRR